MTVAGTGALIASAPPASAATFAQTASSSGSYGTAHIARAGVAVYDRATGQIFMGGDATSQVSAASTIKVFIAADLLFRNEHHSITLSSYDYSRMTPMITNSDNSAADYLWNKYGGTQIVRDIIGRYHLSQTGLSPIPGFWGFTRMTAHDFVIVLAKAADDRGVGPWLTNAMSHSAHFVSGFDQWFGIPASGVHPFAIKQGWTCCDTGDIMNSTGYVGGQWRFAVAIFTSGSTSAGHRAAIDEMARLLIPGGVVPGDSARNPVGFLGVHTVTGSTVNLRGWAFDPDNTSTALTVEVWDGSRLIYKKPTDVLRTDINTQYRVSGNHGFHYTFTAPNGNHHYCVQYDNISWGSNLRFCFNATVNGSPTGALEHGMANPDGSVVLSGWTFDPDGTNQSLVVAVHRDGTDIGHFNANLPRPDVNSAHHVSGGHGYSIRVTQQGDGNHTYCVIGLNYGPPAPDGQLGCRTFTISNNPIGVLETAAGDLRGHVHVVGWTLDPNAPAMSIWLRVSIDGRVAASILTNRYRPGVNQRHNATGLHGFDAQIPTSRGPHSVVVTWINVQGGSNVSLPARQVTTT